MNENPTNKHNKEEKMKRLYLFVLVVFLSLSLAGSTWSQDDSKKKTEKSGQEVQLKDQNQNVETTLNQERNRIIHGPNFVDKNGDGYNDNAPDHDNDGIPNGQDPDYKGAGKGNRQQQFVDKDGDGIADNLKQGKGKGTLKHKNRKGGYGPGDGTGNQGVRPQNGTGFGPGSASGNCDGTGPKGKTGRGSRK
jgi:hypothetical protein